MFRLASSSIDRRVPSLVGLMAVVMAVTLTACGSSKSGCEQLMAVEDAATAMARSLDEVGTEGFSDEVAALRDAVEGVDDDPVDVMGASLAELEWAVGNLADIDNQVRGGAPPSELADTIDAAQEHLARGVASLRATPRGQSCALTN